MEEVFGYIERITFQNIDNGYTVAQLKSPKQKELICVVGIMPAIQPGETVRCFGSWKQHLLYGRQFVVTESRVEAPADVLGIKKYLGSGLIKGIGPTYAKRIVEKFGVETLNIIDESPEKLLEVPGLGTKRLEKIKDRWADQKSIRHVMIFLQSYGISPSFAQKIFKIYGNESIHKIKENPYRLAHDISGIGFKSADAIATKMGIAHEAPQRIDAGILHVLSTKSEEGHVCFPIKEFLEEAENILQVSSKLIEERFSSLENEDHIELFDLSYGGTLCPFLWIKPLFVAETGIAREMQRLLKKVSSLRKIDVSKALEWVQSQLNIQLAPNQHRAVSAAMEYKVHIITGGPGTGKSTITNAILTIAKKLTPKICLVAPTGRAAKRMSEITHYKASTIHSLLEYDFKSRKFKRNRQNPLDCDLIIVDEASMIDTLLMYNFLKAIPSHCKVIFVGDINQLPSVGPGNVLKDLIASNCITTTILTEIFRQAANSRIVINAHLVNNGQFPDLRNLSDSDFFFLEGKTPEEILKNVVSLATERLPRKYGFHPLQDIQVLAPMKKGIIGIDSLNNVLQDVLKTGQNDPLCRFGKRFFVGDKVMQIRNDYTKEVFNGDIGYISKICPMDQSLIVRMEDKEILYEFSDLDELVLAYAVSIHKYQGSECPCIVIPIHVSHYKLLYRNLLYTGLTRGKKMVVLVGSKQAVGIAVRNDEVKKRYTGLKQAMIATQ